MVAADRISVLAIADRVDKLVEIETVLADLPVEIVRAQNAEEAVRALAGGAGQEFALILLDLNMPEADGFEIRAGDSGSQDRGQYPDHFSHRVFG